MATSTKKLVRDGVVLAYEEAGSGSRPIVFVHGWCCNRAFFEPHVRSFEASHRVIAVDLRGHGESDAPDQAYTLATFADDLAWQCAQLGLEKPIIVGHSMGGNVALEFSVRYPDVAAGIVLIDSALFLPAEAIEAIRAQVAVMKTENYREVVRQAASALFLDTDDPLRKEWIIESMLQTPQHVLVSAFVNHTCDYDATHAVQSCRVPFAYLGAASPLGNVQRLRAERPHAIIAQTLGAGHFSLLEVPDQIQAMIRRFLEMGLSA